MKKRQRQPENETFYKTIPARLAKAESNMRASQQREEAHRMEVRAAAKSRGEETLRQIKKQVESLKKDQEREDAVKAERTIENEIGYQKHKARLEIYKEITKRSKNTKHLNNNSK
jgi:hypothetical protein